MEEIEIINALDYQIQRAETFLENRISRERAMAYDYYYGRLFGNEVEGRSQVMSQDVAQVVDSAVPALVKIFVGGDKAVEFNARGPEDVESAELATLGCNYVFFTQNNGYALAHDLIKDGLLQKTGTFSWYWDEEEKTSRRTLNGLDDMQMQMLMQQLEEQGGEIVAHNAGLIEQVPGQPMMMHNVTVSVKKTEGKVKICVLPPEEVLISPDAMSLDVYEMNFIAHAPQKTASELREMGIKQSVIDDLPTGDKDYLYDDEKIARKTRLDATAGLLDESSDIADKSQRLYRFYRCFIRMDQDGDGIAELREIWKVGETILRDEEVDHIPMCLWTPKVMPHEVIGMSLADDVMDIQLLKSTLWRQALDNMYLTSAPRMYVDTNSNVNLDDVLTVRPGGVVRGQGPNGVVPLTVPFTAQYNFQALEYADQESEVRTGISRLFQGIDPTAINKTATGVNALISQANARIELVARNAAEYAFKPLFKGIMYLLAKHQQQELFVRLTNRFTPIDPETWSKEYDMSVNVGLGTGTKEQQLMQLQGIAQAQAMAAQSPLMGRILSEKNLYNLQAKIVELAGFKDPNQFWQDPESVPPPQPQVPPQVQVEQMKIQAQQQSDQMKAQTEQQQSQADMQMEAQKAQAQAQLDLAIARMKAEIDARTKIAIAQINAQVNAFTGAQRQETDGVPS